MSFINRYLLACLVLIRWTVLAVFRLEFERQLWITRRRTHRLINWAWKYPNDHNLGNLILFRHRLRQALYEWANNPEFETLENRDCWEGRRLVDDTTRNIEQLEKAISFTESALG